VGPWGPLIIATVDSAAFGIPLDPVMVAYAWKDRDNLLLVAIYIISAGIGSAVGSLVPYWIGRKGGEPLLLKKIEHKRLEELRDRYESWEFLFVMIPSMLPPPTPMKLIILAAGAFEMRVTVFMLALFLGRVLRFSLVAYLVIHFGERVIEHFNAGLRQSLPWILVLIAGIAIAGYLMMRRKKSTPDPIPQ
jgi:membrane protein YqaA with SNARE-associated domain